MKGKMNEDSDRKSRKTTNRVRMTKDSDRNPANIRIRGRINNDNDRHFWKNTNERNNKTKAAPSTSRKMRVRAKMIKGQALLSSPQNKLFNPVPTPTRSSLSN